MAGKRFSGLTRQGGFSLVEILLAFSLAAGSLALLYDIHARAIQASLINEEYFTAHALVLSLLAEHGQPATLPLQSSSGIFDDKYAWELHYAAFSNEGFSNEELSNTEPQLLPLLELEISLSWQSADRQRSLQFSTLKPLAAVDGSGS